MKTVGNVLWFVVAGIWSAVAWVLFAGVLAVTVVGLPLARQCIKLAHFSLWPMGRQAIADETAMKATPVLNAVWFIPGLILALVYVIAGVLLCITVIGIPFGLQAFKFAKLAFAPFGKKVVRVKDLRAGMAVTPGS